ncbi:hypothetical protein ACQ4PT_011900 [Festuca glaucescens]
MEPLGAIGGRFWSSAGPDDGSDEDSFSSEMATPKPLEYLCRSPSPSSSRSLPSAAGQGRSTDDFQRRINHRREAMEWISVPSPSVSPNQIFKHAQEKKGSADWEASRAAVLEPSVFTLDIFNADESILVERKKCLKAKDRRQVMAYHGSGWRQTTMNHWRRRQPPSSSDRGITVLLEAAKNTRSVTALMTTLNVCSPTRAAMAGRGRSQFPSGHGGAGAGSGAPPRNGNPNSQFPRQSQFEHGGGSGYGNGRSTSGGNGNGFGQFNQHSFNNIAGNSRGSQNFTPQDRFNGNSHFNGGDRWGPNDGLVGDQQGYDQSRFGGDFGNFNEGYFDGGQGSGQNYNGSTYGAAPRPQRPFRNQGQGGRGHGGRGGRGRFNGRTAGIRTPPAIAVVHETVGAPTGQQMFVTPQGIQQQNLTQAVPAATDNNAAVTESVKSVAKKDKLADILCYKCEDTGHFAADCQAILCIYCDSAKDASEECSYPSMPKPTTVMYGLCRDDLLFFDIPKSAGVRSKRDSGKNGCIHVEGGSLSVPQIIKELSFFVPGRHQWEINQIEENVFSVVYPSKADKARLRKINDIKVDDSACTMFFEDGTDQNLDSWRVREAWVRVGGCPKELRDDYFALFAFGSLIGKTKEVAMAFTRSGEVARLLVQVLNPNLIPNDTDHYFEGEGFKITFEVEGREPLIHVDVDMDDDNRDPEDGSNADKNQDSTADRLYPRSFGGTTQI